MAYSKMIAMIMIVMLIMNSRWDFEDDGHDDVHNDEYEYQDDSHDDQCL